MFQSFDFCKQAGIIHWEQKDHCLITGFCDVKKIRQIMSKLFNLPTAFTYDKNNSIKTH